MKAIICDTPSGRYQIPLIRVAEHRANYYATEELRFEKESSEWQHEVDFLMKDDYEAIDWLVNNTDWEEWKEYAMKISNEIRVTEEDFWTNSDSFEII